MTVEKTIVLLEDDKASRLLVSKALDKFCDFSINLIELDSGLLLENILMSGKTIDLIITDIVMPDVEGIEIVTKISESYSHIPIITMSSDSLYLEMTKLLGAIVISKPIDINELCSIVNKAICR